MKNSFKIALILSMLFITSNSYSYIGPGAGLSVIGSVLAFLGAIVLMIIGFFWYPIKRLIKNRKKNLDDDSSGNKDSLEKSKDEPE